MILEWNKTSTEKSIIDEAKNYINNLLTSLDDLYYHQYEHTLDVYKRSTYLAKKEWLNDEEIEIIQLSALFHDTGFVISYDKNEPIGAKIASIFLKTMLYPEEKIKIIERLILATNPDYEEPIDIYEAIIKDADIDNLWRDDFFEKWKKVKSEIETMKRIRIKDPDWHHAMLDILYKNKFFTKTQKEERQQKKDENIENLKTKISIEDFKKKLKNNTK
jgi:predicted metal-dependent HD superfamily phosphohydrolase